MSIQNDLRRYATERVSGVKAQRGAMQKIDIESAASAAMAITLIGGSWALFGAVLV